MEVGWTGKYNCRIPTYLLQIILHALYLILVVFFFDGVRTFEIFYELFIHTLFIYLQLLHNNTNRTPPKVLCEQNLAVAFQKSKYRESAAF